MGNDQSVLIWLKLAEKLNKHTTKGLLLKHIPDKLMNCRQAMGWL